MLSPPTLQESQKENQDQTGKILSIGKHHPQGGYKAKLPESEMCTINREKSTNITQELCPSKNLLVLVQSLSSKFFL